MLPAEGSCTQRGRGQSLFEREMHSGVVMILKIARQYVAQVTLLEDDNVIQAFTADRTDGTLGVGIRQVGEGMPRQPKLCSFAQVGCELTFEFSQTAG